MRQNCLILDVDRPVCQYAWIANSINGVAMTKTSSSSSARERVLETASRLFYRHGIRATGVDKIIAESGVAKMSFYRNFPSKADLVSAFLRKRHDDWMKWFSDNLERRTTGAKPSLGVVADVLKLWFKQRDFRGCAFINAVVEEGDLSSAECAIALEHKAVLQAILHRLAGRIGLANPGEVAKMALIIIEGAIIRAQMTGDSTVADTARKMLKMLEARS